MGEKDGLTDNHMHPLDLPEKSLLSNDVLEGRDENLEVSGLDLDGGVSTSLGSSLRE